jgi:DNA-binding response OmpR family regulator
VDEPRLILVVEDDEATGAFLAENLAADGFRTATASSSGEGLRAVEVRRPSLVLLDLALEAGSGLDLLDRVRASRRPGVATRPRPARDRADRSGGRGGPGPELRARRG